MENDGAADADVTELHPRYSVEDQLACLERELRLRMRVYPPRVANGRMSAGKAKHELAVMETLVREYRTKVQALQQQERLL